MAAPQMGFSRTRRMHCAPHNVAGTVAVAHPLLLFHPSPPLRLELLHIMCRSQHRGYRRRPLRAVGPAGEESTRRVCRVRDRNCVWVVGETRSSSLARDALRRHRSQCQMRSSPVKALVSYQPKLIPEKISSPHSRLRQSYSKYRPFLHNRLPSPQQELPVAPPQHAAGKCHIKATRRLKSSATTLALKTLASSRILLCVLILIHHI